ncbi:unnamed protein product [Arctogadus glacialis]
MNQQTSAVSEPAVSHVSARLIASPDGSRSRTVPPVISSRKVSLSPGGVNAPGKCVPLEDGERLLRTQTHLNHSRREVGRVWQTFVGVVLTKDSLRPLLCPEDPQVGCL